MPSIHVVTNIRRRLSHFLQIGANPKIGRLCQAIRLRSLHLLGNKPRGGRVNLEEPYPPVLASLLHLTHKRGRPQLASRYFALLRRIIRLTQLHHQRPVPGPTQQRHAKQHAAAVIVQHVMPDRIKE